MASRLSLKGTLKRQNTGALHRISLVLHGLVNTLEDLREVKTMLDFESARARSSSDHLESSDEPADLGVVVGTLTKMVGILVSEIEAVPEIQKVLVSIQNPSAANDNASSDSMVVSKQPSSLVGGTTLGESKPVPCISGLESRAVKKASKVSAGAGESTHRCTHRCSEHPELMDPWIWSRLPEHLVQLVFARLPIPQMLDLWLLSKEWYVTLKTSSLRRFCAESHSKMFGILGYNENIDEFWLSAFDVNSSKWQYVDFNWQRWSQYWNAMYAHDGGLVCVVPTGLHPIKVFNPLTNQLKTLPVIDDSDQKEPILVQLVRDAEAGSYRVMLVYRVRRTGFLGADCYNSKTGLWSTMHSGLVYGSGHALLTPKARNTPKLFDCTLGLLHDLDSRSSLQDLDVIESQLVRDRVFVLHESADPQSVIYEVSELVGQESQLTIMRKLNHYESWMANESNNFRAMLFASNGFLLLVVDNQEDNNEFHHQLVQLYDMAAGTWRWIPSLNERFTVEKLQKKFMCELRWDAVP